MGLLTGERFYVDGAGGRQRLRAAFSRLAPDDLVEAARRLGQACADLAAPGPLRRDGAPG